MEDPRAFKPIKENPIILDFSGCKYPGEIHKILKEKFGLPEYYGENWDALWDCMWGLFYECEDFHAKIYGFNSLPEKLRNYCVPMLEVLEDTHKDTPNFTFEVVS